MSKNLVVHRVTRPCPCMTTPVIIKITRVISMRTPHWITVSCHGVEGPMTTGYYCAIFPLCGGGKKKTKKKTKAFYDWATTSIPVIIRQHSIVDWLLSTTPTDRIFFLMKSGLCIFFLFKYGYHKSLVNLFDT